MSDNLSTDQFGIIQTILHIDPLDPRADNQEDIVGLINRCLEDSELLRRPDIPFRNVVDTFNAELTSCCESCFRLSTHSHMTDLGNNVTNFLAAVHFLIALPLDEVLELVPYLRYWPRLAHQLFLLNENNKLLDYFISSYTSTRQIIVDAEIAEKFEVLRRHRCIIFPFEDQRNHLSPRMFQHL